MRKRILKILSGIIFLFALSIVVASHVWIRSSFQEQILKKTVSEFPRNSKGILQNKEEEH